MNTNDSGGGSNIRLLLTPEEAARALSISRAKLYELLSGGVVEAVRIGRSRRVPVEALESFIAALRAAERDSGPYGAPTLQPPKT